MNSFEYGFFDELEKISAYKTPEFLNRVIEHVKQKAKEKASAATQTLKDALPDRRGATELAQILGSLVLGGAGFVGSVEGIKAGHGMYKDYKTRVEAERKAESDALNKRIKDAQTALKIKLGREAHASRMADKPDQFVLKNMRDYDPDYANKYISWDNLSEYTPEASRLPKPKNTPPPLPGPDPFDMPERGPRKPR